MFYLFLYDWADVTPKIHAYNKYTEELLEIPIRNLGGGDWNENFKKFLDNKIRFHGIDRSGFL